MNNSLLFIQDLLGGLRDRVPPQNGKRHNITLTKERHIEIEVVGPIHRICYVDPIEDGHMTATEIVDAIVEELNRLAHEQLALTEK